MITFRQEHFETMRDWPPHQRFWLQHWAESLNFLTEPEYRVRPITIGALFSELSGYLELLQAQSVSHDTVQHLRDEALAALRESEDAAIHFPNERKVLLQRLGSATLKPETAEFQTTLALSRSFAALLQEPFFGERVAETLFDILAAQTGDIDRLANLTDVLISESLLRGFSDRHLYNGMWPVLDQGNQHAWGVTPVERTRRLLTMEVRRDARQHTVVFLFRVFPGGAGELHHLAGIEILRQLPSAWIPAVNEGDRPHPFVQTLSDPNVCYGVARNVVARDRFAAATIARSMLQDALDSLYLAAPGLTVTVDSSALLWHAGLRDEPGEVHGAERARLGWLTDQVGEVEALERRVARIRTDCSAGVAARILDAMHWYTLGLEAASTSIESAFLCFWICLETLFRSRAERGIVQAMRRFACSIYSLYHPQKVARDLSAYFYRLEQVEFPKPLHGRVPSRERGWRPDVEQFTANLLDQAVVAALVETLPLDELLHRRVRDVVSMFTDSKALADAMESHNRLVAWDVARAYRLRNSFVHAGSRGALDPTVAYTCRMIFELARVCLQTLVLRLSHAAACEIEDLFVNYEMTWRDALDRLRSGKMTTREALRTDLLFAIPQARIAGMSLAP